MTELVTLLFALILISCALLTIPWPRRRTRLPVRVLCLHHDGDTHPARHHGDTYTICRRGRAFRLEPHPIHKETRP